jgi:PAS domain S-box-containing protein
MEWNPAAERIFRLQPRRGAWSARTGAYCTQRCRGHVDAVFDDLLTTTPSNTSVNRNITKDGRLILCEWHNTRLLDADGRVIGVASFAQDVTARQQAEEELRASEERYRELCNSLPQTIFEIDRQGQVTFVNRERHRDVRLLGSEIESGFSAYDISFPRIASAFGAISAGHSRAKSSRHRIHRDAQGWPAHPDHDQWVGDHARRPTDVGTRGVITDLTRQKEAEAALEARLTFERLVANLSANFHQSPCTADRGGTRGEVLRRSDAGWGRTAVTYFW